MAEQKPSYNYEFPISKLKLLESNARNHEKTIPALLDSFELFGILNPIIINERYEVSSGHGRIKAALKKGDTTVPVLIAPILNDPKLLLAHNIVDNTSQQLSMTIETLLAKQVEQLRDQMGFDIKRLAIPDTDLKRLLRKAKAIEAPELAMPDTIYQVIVTCDNDTIQAELLEKLEKEGFTCQALML